MKHQTLCVLFLAGSLVACGGGSGSDERSQQPDLATQGMITGFGSVIVNGVHYDVDDADIEMDDESLVESELEVGQIVRITGSVDDDGIHGTAMKVEGETQLRGPIDSIDLTAGVIVALGQTILINADTFYQNGLTPEELEVGNVIKVSSYTNEAGEMVATRIDVKNDITGNSFGFSGTVTNLDTTALTFMINSQLVDYSQVTLANLPMGTLENGMLVRVKGSLVEGVFVAIGNLRLSDLGFKHDDDDEHPDDVEVFGVVTNLVADTSFVLGDITVLITSSTEFEEGESTDLVNGLMVKVEGEWDASNNLIADEIKLKYAPKINNRGAVEAIDLTARTFTVNGATFEVTAETSFKDQSRSNVRFFDLEDLVLGDLIHVRGYSLAATETTPERLIATRVERRNLSDDDEHDDDDFGIEIEGIIEAVNGSTITIDGHDITLDELTMFDGAADLTSFLLIALGAEVEIKAIIKEGVAVAIKVELEDEDHDSEDDDSEDDEAEVESSL